MKLFRQRNDDFICTSQCTRSKDLCDPPTSGNQNPEIAPDYLSLWPMIISMGPVNTTSSLETKTIRWNEFEEIFPMNEIFTKRRGYISIYFMKMIQLTIYSLLYEFPLSAFSPISFSSPVKSSEGNKAKWIVLFMSSTTDKMVFYSCYLIISGDVIYKLNLIRNSLCLTSFNIIRQTYFQWHILKPLKRDLSSSPIYL